MVFGRVQGRLQLRRQLRQLWPQPTVLLGLHERPREPVCGFAPLGMWEPMSEAEALTVLQAWRRTTGVTDTKVVPTKLLPPRHWTTSSRLWACRSTSRPGTSRRSGISRRWTMRNVRRRLPKRRRVLGDRRPEHPRLLRSAPFGGDQWNGVAVRFAQAAALNKPIITGEVGITAGDGQSGCMSLQQRAMIYRPR